MKKLISPPIQALLLTGGAILLGVAVWGVVGLKLQDGTQGQRGTALSVRAPDASMLGSPDMNAYPQMVKAPLFWESRKALAAPKAADSAPAVPLDTNLPEGRLTGIIDEAGKLFAVVQNAAGASVHLHTGESWGAWKVDSIDTKQMKVSQGDLKQTLPLIGDFVAPKENAQMTEARSVQQQQAQQKQRQQQAQAKPARPAMPVAQQVVAESAQPAAAGAAAQNAGLPFPADTEKQPPALSVKDALEARQRLMASRWGNMSGGEPAPGQAPAPVAQH